MAVEASVRNDDVGTKRGICGREVEVNEVETRKRTAKSKVHDFRLVQKAGLRIGLYQSSTFYFEADRFSCIDTSSNNSYEN